MIIANYWNKVRALKCEYRTNRVSKEYQSSEEYQSIVNMRAVYVSDSYGLKMQKYYSTIENP